MAASSQAEDQLAVVDAALAEPMRRLFAEVFGHAMSPEHWDWKYGQGHGTGMGLMRDGRMVAHYGGVSRRVAMFGQPARACQVCDVMVMPSANRALVRRGPLYRVSSGFLQAEVGNDRNHRIAFGFPNQRAHDVANRLGLYGQVDKLVRLSWPAANAAAPDRVRWSAIGQAGVGFSAAERRGVDRLWRRMAPAFSDCVLGVRDADWLQYRFLQHPHQRYEVIAVRSRWLRRWLGVLVLRRHEDHLLLLDLVAPPDAVPLLLQTSRHLAAQANVPRLDAWVTQSQAHRLAGPGDTDVAVVDMQIPVPANVHTPGPGPDVLQDRWFLMAGDADFT